MNIVSINELSIGDRVVIQTSKDVLEIRTVKEIDTRIGLIVFEETAPLDYAPLDVDNIVIMDERF